MELVLSILMFFGSLLLIGFVIWALPANYFVSDDIDNLEFRDSFVLSKLWYLIRNLLGVVLIILGIIMLVLPGQGVLTIIIGLILVDFPGKKYLLNRLISSKSVQKSLNYLRVKLGKEPFIFPNR